MLCEWRNFYGLYALCVCAKSFLRLGDDSGTIIGGVDDARSFGIILNHAADFSAGAKADYVQWVMLEGATQEK